MTPSLALPPGFAPPDFSAPLDLAGHLAKLGAHAAVKGTVAATVVDAVNAAGRPPITSKRFMPFRDYPMAEVLELQVAGATALYPGLPIREGLRRLGADGFASFMKTLLGRVMYGVFGNTVSSVFRVANKGFEVMQNTGTVRTIIVDDNAVKLVFASTYTFLDSHHVGIVEGALAACGRTGVVGVKLESPTDGEIYAAWGPRK